MIPVAVIRPEPGCTTTVTAARQLGLDAHGFPLFAVRALDWDAPPADGFDALLIGSANALRHGGAAIERYRGKPAYVVGDSTAEVARAAGLEVVATGTGGLQGVLDGIRPEHGRLLRLAGREHVDLTPPAGATIAERVVYASEPQPLPAELRALLAAPALVLLHSAEAARHFARLCDESGVARSHILLAALGPRVAEAAGQGWRELRVAPAPRDAALLAIASEMCQDRGPETMDKSGSMQDEPLTQPVARAPRTGSIAVLSALFAFVVGAALAGWLAWSGELGRFLPSGADDTPAPIVVAPNLGAANLTAGGAGAAPPALAALGGVETRLALIEDRLGRIDAQADAASGNAARAENLLIAFAARRLIDRGARLGYVEDQLKLRFGGAQAAAVQAVIDAAARPVTLDQLIAQLDAAGPMLSGAVSDESVWTRARRELSSLLVLRRAATPTVRPLDRVTNAKLMLAAGRIDEAIAEVEHLPGADDAQEWIDAARRYGAGQRALDLIETTAMLEPRQLADGQGLPIYQPSPLAPPAPAPPPSPAASAAAE